MTEYWVDLIARSLASATVAVVVNLPFAFFVLWTARANGVFALVGWPDPTNKQMFLIALFTALFAR